MKHQRDPTHSYAANGTSSSALALQPARNSISKPTLLKHYAPTRHQRNEEICYPRYDSDDSLGNDALQSNAGEQSSRPLVKGLGISFGSPTQPDSFWDTRSCFSLSMNEGYMPTATESQSMSSTVDGLPTDALIRRRLTLADLLNTPVLDVNAIESFSAESLLEVQLPSAVTSKYRLHEASDNCHREESFSPMDLGNPEPSSLFISNSKEANCFRRYSHLVHDGFCMDTLSGSPLHTEDGAMLLVDSPPFEEILMSPFDNGAAQINHTIYPQESTPHFLDDGVVDLARALSTTLRSNPVSCQAIKPYPPTRSVLSDMHNVISPASVLASFIQLSPGTICKDAENQGTVIPSELVFPSPPLYAHTGIDINEFEYRTRRYKMRHSGKEVDKGWLANYAGRFSENGEVLDNYRCYIAGCGHTNKRRDHILVHVGAHANIRPYVCKFCGQRFFRKNECKRHEEAHQKLRSHECHVCKKTFVRQDLVRRHLRKQHGGVFDESCSASRSVGKKQKGKREGRLLSTI